MWDGARSPVCSESSRLEACGVILILMGDLERIQERSSEMPGTRFTLLELAWDLDWTLASSQPSLNTSPPALAVGTVLARAIPVHSLGLPAGQAAPSDCTGAASVVRPRGVVTPVRSPWP